MEVSGKYLQISPRCAMLTGWELFVITRVCCTDGRIDVALE